MIAENRTKMPKGALRHSDILKLCSYHHSSQDTRTKHAVKIRIYSVHRSFKEH
jgi:hypothetical protein